MEGDIQVTGDTIIASKRRALADNVLLPLAPRHFCITHVVPFLRPEVTSGLVRSRRQGIVHFEAQLVVHGGAAWTGSADLMEGTTGAE